MLEYYLRAYHVSNAQCKNFEHQIELFFELETDYDLIDHI